MADFGSMSADQINASMGFGPGGVGDQNQALLNNLYGPQGFGGQTAAYAGLGAAYTGATGGNIYGGGNNDPFGGVGSRGLPEGSGSAYNYGSMYDPGAYQSPSYDYGSMYQPQQPALPQTSMYNPSMQGLLGYTPDAYTQQSAAQQPSYDYGSMYSGGNSYRDQIKQTMPAWYAANGGDYSDNTNSFGMNNPDPNRLLGYDPNNSANAGGSSSYPYQANPNPTVAGTPVSRTCPPCRIKAFPAREAEASARQTILTAIPTMAARLSISVAIRTATGSRHRCRMVRRERWRCLRI